jgi:hypothetical protein
VFLLVAIRNTALGQVIRRQFQGHSIARQNADSISAQFAGKVGQDGAFLLKLNAEQSAGEFFNDGSSNFNTVFFAH